MLACELLSLASLSTKICGLNVPPIDLDNLFEIRQNMQANLCKDKMFNEKGTNEVYNVCMFLSKKYI